MDQFMTTSEASAYLHFSIGHLGTLRSSGKGPKYLKPSPRKVLYRKKDLDEWLNPFSADVEMGRR